MDAGRRRRVRQRRWRCERLGRAAGRRELCGEPHGTGRPRHGQHWAALRQIPILRHLCRGALFRQEVRRIWQARGWYEALAGHRADGLPKPATKEEPGDIGRWNCEQEGYADRCTRGGCGRCQAAGDPKGATTAQGGGGAQGGGQARAGGQARPEGSPREEGAGGRGGQAAGHQSWPCCSQEALGTDGSRRDGRRTQASSQIAKRQS
mmetsp:Transcript_27644/g.70429  ORF Transcript_27644/g.70429 Transcript_27644/m.70429 type:complete len:207 (+) Transcript_27644:581-1201(+)